MTQRPPALSVTELKKLVDAGDIDTVIISFTDMQGRLVGKRMTARLFVEDAMEHGAECCNYLLAVDVENNTVPGYEFSSWDKGYNDMAMIPDMSTLRIVPWIPHTALVMADLQTTDHEPVALAPRSILTKQIQRLAEQKNNKH